MHGVLDRPDPLTVRPPVADPSLQRKLLNTFLTEALPLKSARRRASPHGQRLKEGLQ
jgi:hypothetical protein